MADKIIDLTGSPAPPTSTYPRVMRLRSLCARRTRPRRAIKSLCMNPSGCCGNQYCVASWVQKRLAALNSTTVCPISMSTPPVAKYAPVTDQIAPASLYPRGSNLNEAQILERKLFAMEKMKHWRRRLSKIARNNMWNTTTPQIQSYPKSFFGHQPSTYSYYKNMDPNQMYATAISGNGPLNLFPNPVMPKPQPITLPLFPEEATFSLVAPAEVRSNTRDEGDLDLDLNLELNLGLS